MVDPGMRCDSYFLPVDLAQGNLPNAGGTVQGGRNLSISHGGEAILISGKRIRIFLGDVFESSEINADAGFATFLRQDGDGACPCVMARLFDLEFQHLVDWINNDMPFGRPRAVRVGPNGYCVRWRDDGVLGSMDSPDGDIPQS